VSFGVSSRIATTVNISLDLQIHRHRRVLSVLPCPMYLCRLVGLGQAPGFQVSRRASERVASLEKECRKVLEVSEKQNARKLPSVNHQSFRAPFPPKNPRPPSTQQTLTIQLPHSYSCHIITSTYLNPYFSKTSTEGISLQNRPAKNVFNRDKTS